MRMLFHHTWVTVVIISWVLVSCGASDSNTGSERFAPDPLLTPFPEPLPVPDNAVTISGTITYERINHFIHGGLNYDDITVLPVRGAIVELLGENDTHLAYTRADENGFYTFAVTPNSNVRVRVRAEFYRADSAFWHLSVTDNTQANALYVMEGGVASSADGNTRNLHAISGWDGEGYNNPRVAAPFAILDAVYDALNVLESADPSIQLQPTELRWSENNVASRGRRSDGLIGASFYDPAEGNMYLLGDANNNTDEYDFSLIQHEFAHFIEDTLSRSDSIGGPHRLGEILDMRVAFSEGLANAFTGLVSQTGVYIDAFGPGQQFGFLINLEDNGFANDGWFSENSVGRLIYDFADAENEEGDLLSLGFTPIYETLSSPSYIDQSALISIYTFLEVFKIIADTDGSDDIDAMAQRELIFGVGPYGEGEINDGQISFSLPVYASLSENESIEVCSNNRLAEYNGLDTRRLIRLNYPAGTYQLEVTTSSGVETQDPDVLVYRNGNLVQSFENDEINREAGELVLTDDEHILEVYNWFNVDNDPDDIPTGGNACFMVSLEQ